jgi:hypothetical protein
MPAALGPVNLAMGEARGASGMEAEYKMANDFVMNAGQGLLEEGKYITQYVKKLCPFYYELHPIMADRASTKPLASFESEGISKFSAIGAKHSSTHSS